jgi:dephospho-CoA kinase
MTKVIGLVGEKGSGKQTFVNFIKEIAPNLTIRQVRFSDILAQTLVLWDIPQTRPNLQNLAIVMNEKFGAQALANAAKFSIEGDMADIIILDGIRRESEFKLVKEMKNSLVIYITAESDLRYKRLKLRSEKVGEIGLSYEQFLKEEESKAESEISKLSKKADISLENNGTKEEFKDKIIALNIISS